MKLLKLSLFTFFSLAFIGQQSVYAQGSIQSQLNALQAEEATLLSENKTLKQQIKTTEETIEKKKKTIRRGAWIGGIGAVAGAGGLLFSKDRKNKTARMEQDIADIKNTKNLIADILRLSAKLCGGETGCKLVQGGDDLAISETALKAKSKTQLQIIKAKLLKQEEYEKMIAFLVTEDIQDCKKRGTCGDLATTDGYHTFEERVEAYKEKWGYDSIKVEYDKLSAQKSAYDEARPIYDALVTSSILEETGAYTETKIKDNEPEKDDDAAELTTELTFLKKAKAYYDEKATLLNEVKAFQVTYSTDADAKADTTLTDCFEDLSAKTRPQLQTCKDAFSNYSKPVEEQVNPLSAYVKKYGEIGTRWNSLKDYDTKEDLKKLNARGEEKALKHWKNYAKDYDTCVKTIKSKLDRKTTDDTPLFVSVILTDKTVMTYAEAENMHTSATADTGRPAYKDIKPYCKGDWQTQAASNRNNSVAKNKCVQNLKKQYVKYINTSYTSLTVDERSNIDSSYALTGIITDENLLAKIAAFGENKDKCPLTKDFYKDMKAAYNTAVDAKNKADANTLLINNIKTTYLGVYDIDDPEAPTKYNTVGKLTPLVATELSTAEKAWKTYVRKYQSLLNKIKESLSKAPSGKDSVVVDVNGIKIKRHIVEDWLKLDLKKHTLSSLKEYSDGTWTLAPKEGE